MGGFILLDVAVAAFVPWALLAGAVRARLLVPGALLFALLMITVRPATQAWLPGALEASADRYGSIGVAFTYLAWLYVASFCFLATALVGQVIATDHGPLGRRVRGVTTSHRPSDEAGVRLAYVHDDLGTGRRTHVDHRRAHRRAVCCHHTVEHRDPDGSSGVQRRVPHALRPPRSCATIWTTCTAWRRS